MMETEKYISKQNGKFSIDKIFNEKQYNFGVFDTYEEALKELEFLEDEGWPISNKIVETNTITDDLGLSINNIEKTNGKFVIFKLINNEKVIFGEFDNLDDAKQIRNNLIDNAWESTEPYTSSEYGKYIKKEGDKFCVKRIYKGKYYNFGSFKTLDDAIKCRENLVSTNWGNLKISIGKNKHKYISYNGYVYTIQKMVDGSINVYGFFNKLEDAIKQRDWLIENNWSKLEVPDDSKRYIHKRGDEYLIYKRSSDNIEYFGSFKTLEEAKRARNKLMENNWSVKVELNLEKISEFIYFDGDFYTIKKDVNGQNRVYGVYKNKKQAISDEKELLRYDWDGPYVVATDEYPYGENIVPFDYIFILEDFNDGKPKEIGRYYNFRDAVVARNEKFGKSNYDFSDEVVVGNEKFGKSNHDLDKLTFSVKIGKSYKNRGWSIIRNATYDLVPKLPYEDECDIIVDGIPTKGKLNLLPRIFYNKTENIVNHLEKLANSNPDGRVDVQLLLNKENIFDNSKNMLELNKQNNLNKEIIIDNSNMIELNNKIKSLNDENTKLNQDINELKEILEYIDDENMAYLVKFNNLNKIVDELSNIQVMDEELDSISNSNLKIKISNILEHIKSLKNNLN